MQAHTLGLERGYPQECVLFCLLGDQTQDTSSVGLSEGSWCFLNQKPPPALATVFPLAGAKGKLAWQGNMVAPLLISYSSHCYGKAPDRSSEEGRKDLFWL